MPFFEALTHRLAGSAGGSRAVDQPAAWSPDRPAVILSGRRGEQVLSYAELLDAGQQAKSQFCDFAQAYRRPVVAVLARRSLEFVRTLVAIEAAGFIVAVVEPAWPAAIQKQAVEGIGAAAIIDPDETDAKQALDITARAVSGNDYIGSNDYREQARLIVFSSGTTGNPKPTARTPQSWRSGLERSQELFASHPDSVTVSPASFAFSLTLYSMAEVFWGGGAFYLLPRPSPAALVQSPATRMVATSTFFRSLKEGLARVGSGRTVLPETLTTLVSAGEAMDKKTEDWLAQVFPKACLYEYFGASEMGFVAYRRRQLDEPVPTVKDSGQAGCDAAAGGQLGHGVGQVFPGVKLRIRQGIIWTRSDQHAMRLKQTESGVEFMPPPRWASCGDRGYLAGGELYLLGRDMVTIGGVNVYPQATEQAIRQTLPTAAVLALPDDRLGHRLAAAVTRELSQEEISALVSQLVPAQRPHHWVVLDDWPLNASGKTDRARLRQLCLDKLAQKPQPSAGS